MSQESLQQDGTKAPNSDVHGKAYFEVLSKYTTTLNWLFLTLLIFAGSNCFFLYRWHYGNIRYAREREGYNLAHIDKLMSTIKLNNSGYFNDMPAALLDSIKKNPMDSERFKKGWLVEKVSEESAYLKKLSEDGNFSTLPFIGLNFVVTDYIIVLAVMGTILFFWFTKVLRACRDTLKEYFNSRDELNPSDMDIIPALFFFLLPASRHFRRYRSMELGLWVYVLSLLLLIVSDGYEYFISHDGSYGLAMTQNPGFSQMIPHAIASAVAIIGSFVFCVIGLRRANVLFEDLRNLVILSKWSRRALLPGLRNLLAEKELTLRNRYNFIEYRRAKQTEKMYLCISLTAEGSEKPERIIAAVNLPESLRNYYKKNGAQLTDRGPVDPELGRPLSVEESEMRDYFKKILTDDYECELAREWANGVLAMKQDVRHHPPLTRSLP